MKPIERLMLFRHGFRDGAGGLAHRHPSQPDYMTGYQRGSVDAGRAADEFARELGYEWMRDILRAGHAPSGCEWNPIERRPAFEHEDHFLSVRAEVLIGKNGHYRVCSACARLPEFRRFKRRPIVATEGSVVP